MVGSSFVTVDLEDWFHSQTFSKVIDRNDWDVQKSNVEQYTKLVLEELDKRQIRATFFVLAWVAERRPELIRLIDQNGHEVASHGYGHQCIYDLSPQQFEEDISKSTAILEDILGKKIYGYRAPNFSITDWAIDILSEKGFRYDSSYYRTIFHDRYGTLEKYRSANTNPYMVKDNFYEVPLSSLKLGGTYVPWSGGGYFRLMPYGIFKKGARRILNVDGNFNFYIHPWEFDSTQEVNKSLSWSDKFRHYNNLEKTRDRFRLLLDDMKFVTISKYLEL